MTTQPDRYVWIFEAKWTSESDSHFMATEYQTEDTLEAVATLESEYGCHAISGKRLKLTFSEYAAMLMCNGKRMETYQAILGVFFRGIESLAGQVKSQESELEAWRDGRAEVVSKDPITVLWKLEPVNQVHVEEN